MLNRIILLSLCMLSISLYAQAPDALLSKVKAKYAKMKSFSASFTQTLTDAKGKKIEYKGSLKISGDMFAISLPDQQLLSNGKAIWLYFKDVNEVTISPVENDGSELLRPSYYFSIPTEEFMYKAEGDAKVGTVMAKKYKFTPKDKKANFHTLNLLINPTTNEIMQAEIIDKQQQKLIFNISNQKAQTFAATDFSFDSKKYPGISVTDNR